MKLLLLMHAYSYVVIVSIATKAMPMQRVCEELVYTASYVTYEDLMAQQ